MTKKDKIILEIYRDLYLNSEPSADFDTLMSEAPIDVDGRKIIDFMSYEISEEKYNEILKSHFKDKKLTPLSKKAISATIYLGVSPKFKK